MRIVSPRHAEYWRFSCQQAFFFPSLEPELYVHMPLALKPKPRQFMMSGNEEGAEQKELMELFMGPNFTKVTGASGWEDFLIPTIQDVDPNYIRRFVSRCRTGTGLGL